MVELSKNKLNMAMSRNVAHMMEDDFDVDLVALNRDIDKLKTMLEDKTLGREVQNSIKTALWVLGKWQMLESVRIALQFSEKDGFMCRDKETDCDYIRELRLDMTPEYRFAELCGNFNVKYLRKSNYRLLVVDHAELSDAVAFEYCICDTELDAHTINVWTKDATIYTINDSKIIMDMVYDEMGVDIPGRVYDIVRGLMISPLCLKVQLNGDTILTHMGTKMSTNRKENAAKRLYNRVLSASSDEILSTIIDAAGNSAIKQKMKIVGFTNSMQLAVMVDNSVSCADVQEAFSAVARILNKRYEFRPAIYEYIKESDELVKRV